MTHTNTTLQHYGIKGMRWGVRRTDAQLGRVRRQKPSNDVNVKKTATTATKKKRKDTDDMSDEELKRRVNRLNMEKQYANLTKKEISPGRKFVQEVLLNASKQVATNYTAKFMTQGIDSLLGIASKSKTKKTT